MELSATNHPLRKNGINLLYVIGLSVAIAIIMVLITIYSFYHSGAYTTVKQIQTGTELANSLDVEAIDVQRPINASDIDKYAQTINLKLQSLNDDADFGPEDVSDSALGLN